MVAERTGVPYVTIFRYARKQKENPLSQIRLTPKYNSRQIFNKEQEDDLVNYLLTLSKMSYGMTIAECRKLAYEMAVRNNIQVPQNWAETKEAGTEWFRGFKKRHPKIAIRSPEACSLSRMTAFNKHNVSVFFDKLATVYSRSQKLIDGTRVYNLDETSTTTVQKPKKIIAGKGIKQVNKCTSGERGQNVTTCCIINASGSVLPPVMVFPRKNFKIHMISGAPHGTLGLVSPTGWMTTEIFSDVMAHFIKYSQSSKENPTLLIMDNHESHISLATIDKARDNGVTILTLPPHCSHRLQPLDVSVFASFKAHYNSAVDNWLLHHPGTPMTIYQVAECVGLAHDRSMTPSNIKSGFKRSGIFPFDRNIFNDSDFMSSAVTDQPMDHLEDTQRELTSSSSGNLSLIENETADKENTEPNQLQSAFVSPTQFRGFPKAKPRKGTTNRRKGKSMIATDTPEKNIIEERQGNRAKVSKKAVEKSKRKVLESSSDEDDNISLYSETENFIPELDPNAFEDLERPPTIGDFVLVQFKIQERKEKEKAIYYVGQVIKNKDEQGEIEVNFYRRHSKTGKFVLPAVPDVSTIEENAIKMVLPKPSEHGRTKRQVSLLSFEIGFDNIEIR